MVNLFLGLLDNAFVHIFLYFIRCFFHFCMYYFFAVLCRHKLINEIYFEVQNSDLFYNRGIFQEIKVVNISFVCYLILPKNYQKISYNMTKNIYSAYKRHFKWIFF